MGIVLLVATLFVSGLGVGHSIVGRTSNKALSFSGVVALATLLVFIGFFVVAAVAWVVALSHS